MGIKSALVVSGILVLVTVMGTAWGRDAARTGSSGRVLTQGAGRALPGLRVSGNRLVDSTGKRVILRGVDRSGSEYACIQGWGFFDGPVTDASIKAMKKWGINGVNVGLNEDCWLGINGVKPAYSGRKYIDAIGGYVRRLEANRIYPVIVLFWEAPGKARATDQSSMPDADHAVAFWRSVARVFKADNRVLLRLKEEPFPLGSTDTAAAWRCWLKGCTDFYWYWDGSKSVKLVYKAVGMQALIDVIRSTRARNVIQVPGVQYANSMTHFLAYQPGDPRHNLMGVVDVYPDMNLCGSPSCYDRVYAPIIKRMPFMAGEFGESVNGNICSVAKSNVLMNWLDAYQSGYFAWTWDTWGTSCGDLSLITSYGGTPKAPNGTNFKAHLAKVLRKS